MATTIDDLIALKDEAVAACQSVVADSASQGLLGGAAGLCQNVIAAAELYDAADADDDAVSVEDYEHRISEQIFGSDDERRTDDPKGP